MKKILFTVCGRAGSKGMRSKNITPFLGKPLVHYTLKFIDNFIRDYQNSYEIDAIVSSDSEFLLSNADEFPYIMKRDRDVALAQDDTPKVPVIQDAVLKAESEKKKKYDLVIDLDITSPLRKNGDVLNAIKLCDDEYKNYDLIFSAVPARRNPYFNMVELIDGGYAKKIKDSNFVCRQQAPSVYDMNASIYCYKRESLINKLKKSTFEGISGLVEMEETYVIDIDHEEDFEILEILVERLYSDKFPELFRT